jgi:hypothetical protein
MQSKPIETGSGASMSSELIFTVTIFYNQLGIYNRVITVLGFSCDEDHNSKKWRKKVVIKTTTNEEPVHVKVEKK